MSVSVDREPCRVAAMLQTIWGRRIMYNDPLFNAFARSFEARSETDMSMAESLESCRGDPMRYANAAERLLASIGEPQRIDKAKDPRLGRIFLNRTMRADR